MNVLRNVLTPFDVNLTIVTKLACENSRLLLRFRPEWRFHSFRNSFIVLMNVLSKVFTPFDVNLTIVTKFNKTLFPGYGIILMAVSQRKKGTKIPYHMKFSRHVNFVSFAIKENGERDANINGVQ